MKAEDLDNVGPRSSRVMTNDVSFCRGNRQQFLLAAEEHKSGSDFASKGDGRSKKVPVDAQEYHHTKMDS